MTRIAQQLKTDKRTNSKIKADVLATRVIVSYNNLTLNLSRVEAQRLGKVLTKATSIQETRLRQPKTAPISDAW